MKNALITGVTGQDGSYLAESLMQKGYAVYGLLRRSSAGPSELIESLHRQGMNLIYGDLRDIAAIKRALEEAQPDEIYNLAAQSHVGISFKVPEETWEINYHGLGRIVTEVSRQKPDAHIYQASTSEMFGSTPPPQNEGSPFNPVSPYAEAKLAAHRDYVEGYRERHGMYICSGILFNHESPRRGKHFVTRKITYSLAKMKLGLQDHLELGNLSARRDWGHAKEYVEAMQLMLSRPTPEDFVISTGRQHTVREFVDAAANVLGINIHWEGEAEKEVGLDENGKVLVKVNPEFYRPREVHDLLGDSSKAHRMLGWEPKMTFEELVEDMVTSDLDFLTKANGLSLTASRTIQSSARP